MAPRRLWTAEFTRPKAITNGVNSSDKVDHGTLNGFNAAGSGRWSAGWMIKPTTLTSGRVLGAKGNIAGTQGWQVELTGTSGDLQIRQHGVVDATYASNTAPLILNRWQFVVCTFDRSLPAGAKGHIYVTPSLTAPFGEVGYGAPAEGTSLADDAIADSCVFLNNIIVSPILAIQADCALYWYAPNVIYTYAQCEEWREQPLLPPNPYVKLFSVCDIDGAARIRDLTGNLNHGTMSGGVPTAGVSTIDSPTRRFLPFRSEEAGFSGAWYRPYTLGSQNVVAPGSMAGAGFLIRKKRITSYNEL